MTTRNRAGTPSATRARVQLADNGSTLRLYGVVGDWIDDFDDSHVADLIEQAESLSLVRINSPGGFVHQGMAIYTLLRERGGFTTRVDGLAASMASVIALAGDRVEIAQGAMFMVHNPWNVMAGDAREFRKNADMLDKVRDSILSIYAARTGQDRDILIEMMDEETWLTAEEAVEWGFADAIAGEAEPLDSVDLSPLAEAKNAPEPVRRQIEANVESRSAAVAQAIADRGQPPGRPEDDPSNAGEGKPAPEPPASPAASRRPAATTDDEGDEMDEAAKAEARQEAVAEERKRAKEIRSAVATAKLESKLAEDLIEEGVTVDVARARIIDAWAAKDPGPAITPQNRGGFGDRDETVTRRNAVAKAILHRFDPRGNKIDGDDPARQYAGMTLREMARAMVEGAGIDTRDMTAHKVAQAALTHTSSDFPLILENVVTKSLRDAYELAPRTFLPIARQATLPDYKEVSRAQLGEAPKLQKVLEGGEYTFGTVGEAAEKYKLIKYGKILSLTAESIINDDLDAFTRIPSMMGAAAGQLESEMFWAHFLANPTMQDGTALFHADHGNLAGSGAVISIASIGAGRARMRLQKGLDGEHFINAQPSYILVPTALETTAEQFVATNVMPNKASEVNPFTSLQPIAEPRLDADSATAWYLVADPARSGVETFEFAYLQGEEGPVIETQDGFDVDGMKIKVRHSFGVKALDWRGVDKNPGA